MDHDHAVGDLNRWREEPLENSLWLALLWGGLISLIPLAFIWLGVFVAYVVVRARRVFDEGRDLSR